MRYFVSFSFMDESFIGQAFGNDEITHDGPLTSMRQKRLVEEELQRALIAQHGLTNPRVIILWFVPFPDDDATASR